MKKTLSYIRIGKCVHSMFKLFNFIINYLLVMHAFITGHLLLYKNAYIEICVHMLYYLFYTIFIRK